MSEDQFEPFPSLPVEHDGGDTDDGARIAPEGLVAEDRGGVGASSLLNHARELEVGRSLVGSGWSGDVGGGEELVVVP